MFVRQRERREKEHEPQMDIISPQILDITELFDIKFEGKIPLKEIPVNQPAGSKIKMTG